MRTILTPWLALLFGCVANSDPDTPLDTSPEVDTGDPDLTDPDPTDPHCAYPAGAVEPMALGEALAPYRWPEARNMATGQRAPLDLAHVPCESDGAIDWSPFDVLLFISVPAW